MSTIDAQQTFRQGVNSIHNRDTGTPWPSNGSDCIPETSRISVVNSLENSFSLSHPWFHFQDDMLVPRFAGFNRLSYGSVMVQFRSFSDQCLQLLPEHPCCSVCSSHCDSDNLHSQYRSPTHWAQFNQTVSEVFMRHDALITLPDAGLDDILIRVMIEGWEAVGRQTYLHTSWDILRRIDERLFFRCPKTERLAILGVMHMLIQCHAESFTDIHGDFPPWSMPRPSQKDSHSYAIDYVVWLGLRERLIFDEHHYCGNEFWNLFYNNLRFVSPLEFHHCHTRNSNTG